jgi:hypothetical protein
VGHVTRVTHDLLRFREFALHGRGCGGYPACFPARRAGGFCVSLPRPSFIALNIYAPPQHLVLTTMLHEIVKGPEAPYAGGGMQDPAFGLPRTHLLPRTRVNKPPINAPELFRWHHAHDVDPIEKRRSAW